MLDMVNRAIRKPEAITPQDEENFLRTKARIAMLHDSFMDSLKHDKAVGTNMIEIVNRAITLKGMGRISEAENKKLEIEWHEVYLLLNETVSTLNEKRAELAEINEMMFKLGKLWERTQTNFKAFLRSIYFKLMVATAAILFIVYGVPAMGIYDWDKLRDIRPLQPVISGTFWMGRAVGISAPYFTLREFTERSLKDPVGGLIHTTHTTEKPKSAAARDIADVMMARVTDRDARDNVRQLLEGAESYEALRFRNDNETQTGFVYLFWFRRVPEARRVMSLLNPHTVTGDLSADFRVTQKSNVIAITFSRHQDFGERIYENRIEFMRP